MREVTSKELSGYKVLPFDIFSESNVKILSAGEILTPGKLILLKNYPQLFSEEINNVIKESDYLIYNKESSELIDFTYDEIEVGHFETIINKYAYITMEDQVRLKFFYKRIFELIKQSYYKEAVIKLKTLIEILKEKIFRSDNNKESENKLGSRIRLFGEYELCHPLNVAIISGMIARKLDYSNVNIDNVMMASILHDIGKLKIDLGSVNPFLTMNERDVMKHTELGYQIISKDLELPHQIALVALEHHENNDGSGYPKGTSNDFITPYSQIVNVANYYDNLAFNRGNFFIGNNKEALRKMLEVGTRKFSAEMLFTFVHMFSYDDIQSFSEMTLE